MDNLYICITFTFLFCLVLNYISLISKKSAMETVNDMGLGYNLGKTYDQFINFKDEEIENNQIKIWGTILPTKKMISKIKKNGFKTIRFQVISNNAIDDSGKINIEWISGIREIVEWALNYNMYFILSVNFEGNYFLVKSNKDKYINFWTQIANEFVDINEYLILESKNIIDYEYLYEYSQDNKNDDYYDEYEKIHNNLLNCNQGFVDAIRNSGGSNSDRLLILSGLVTEMEITYYGYFFEIELPIDPSNKIAVSVNYLFPSENYLNFDLEPMLWYNKYGMMYSTNPVQGWGSELDYRQLMKVFDFLKKYYLDKEIPVIFGEVGIILNENDNNINKMEEFLYVIFSISSEYNGIMSCLWDISEIIERNINYYNKKNNLWRDEKIRDNFIKISKGKYVHSSEYYYMTNYESENIPIYNILDMDIGTRKITKIILNATISCELRIDCNFAIITSDKEGNWYDIEIKGNGKKQYDGTRIFSIDVSNLDCNDHVEAIVSGIDDPIILNNLTVEFEEKFLYFDYKSYRTAVLDEIKSLK